MANFLIRAARALRHRVRNARRESYDANILYPPIDRHGGIDAPEWVEVGGFTYGSAGRNRPRFVRHMDDERISIGSYCSIGPGVTFMAGGNHRIDTASSYPFRRIFERGPRSAVSRGALVVGNDVWIGREALVLSGCTVGDGAVIGARAVVSRDVPPYAVVAGNPAQVVRKRFEPEVVAALLRIRWWEWPPERIRERLEWFEGPVESFVERFDV